MPRAAQERRGCDGRETGGPESEREPPGSRRRAVEPKRARERYSAEEIVRRRSDGFSLQGKPPG